MKNAVSLIGICCSLALVGCSNSPTAPEAGKVNTKPANSVNAPKSPDGPEEAKANDPKRTLTIDQYDKLVVGMSQAEAEQIIGWKGKVTGRAEADKSITVFWKTEGSESILAIFAGDKLTQKMQFNLK